MKQIPLLLQASRDTGVTTECMLVKVRCVGAFEGQILGFTSLDAPLTYDDGAGPITYAPDYGFDPSAFETTNTTAIDNAEAIGFLLDDAITYEMVRAGLFNYAEVTAYRIDFMDPGKGHEEVFTGTCGETTFTDNSWKVEFRGIAQRLHQTMSQQYSKDYCRVPFGSPKCGMPFVWVDGTVDEIWQGGASRGFYCDALTQEDGYFVPGVVRWMTGRNAGYEMDVAAFETTSDGPFVRLLLPLPFPIEPSDTFRIRRDCDKSVAMCTAYGNQSRYRMEPLINLTGEGLYSFTPAKIDSNYGSLIGSILGAIVGYFFGNAKTGAQVGGAIGGLILPDTAVGPRLAEASTQTNAVVTQIPFGYGSFSVAGNIIEAGESTEHEHKKKNFLGITTSKTYTSTRSFKVGVCEGAISSYLQIRRDGKTIYYGGSLGNVVYTSLVGSGTVAATDEVRELIDQWPSLNAAIANPNLAGAVALWNYIYTNAPGHGGIPDGQNPLVGAPAFLAALKAAGGLSDLEESGSLRLFYGTEQQEFFPCVNLDTEGLSPAYKGLAYVAFNDYDVTETGGSLPTFEFIVSRGAAKSYTTPPYPAISQDRIGTSSVAMSGDALLIPLDEAQVSTRALDGTHRDLVVPYAMDPEEVDVETYALDGTHRALLLIYENYPPEELETSTYALDGTHRVIRLDYLNYEPEEIEVTTYALDGTHGPA